MYQQLPVTLTEKEKKKIQKRIDELNFVKGLNYNFVYGDNDVPVENASLETIYYAFTNYTSVSHVDKLLDSNELNANSPKHSQIEGGTDDEETPFLMPSAIQLKHNTFHVELIDHDQAKVTYLAHNEELCKIFSLTEKSEIKNLEALLPEKGTESRNLTLLRMLCQTTTELHNISSQNLENLLLWVKHYDGSYKTVSLTPADLKLQTFRNFNPNDSKKDQIIELLTKKEVVNTGIRNMLDDEQFMPDDYKQKIRTIKFRYYTGSLVLEGGFAYLSFISSLEGWRNLLTARNGTPMMLALSGTIIDFIVNISTISSANCANAYAILQKKLEDLNKELSPNMKRLMQIIDFLQESSFFIGGAGNALFLFKLCKPLYQIHPALFYIVTIAGTVPIAKLGREYYWGFMAERYFKSIIAFDKYLKTTRPDNDVYRNLMIFMTSLIILLFRSPSFGAIATYIVQGLNPTDHDAPWIRWLNFFVALYFTLATAVSVSFTRINTVVDNWSNPAWAHLTQHQKNAGWKVVNVPKTLLSLTTLECLIMGAGLLFISGLEKNSLTYGLAALSVLIVYISCMAQIRREICIQATNILKENGISVNIEQNRDAIPNQNHDTEEAQEPLLNNEDQMFKNIQALERIFTSLRSPNEGIWSLVGTIALCCFISVVTRGLSFLGFMDLLNSVLSAVIEFSAKNKIIIGLALVLGPSNLNNLYRMFYENFMETMAQKYGVERKIAADNDKIPDSFSGKFGYYLGTLYQTGGWSFTAGEARKTIDNEIEQLKNKLGYGF